MPKLWHETIEAHRSAVADTIMDRTAAIAASEGMHTLTMARVAQEAGIGRATLYKYFKDVGDILTAWHRRQISTHLAELEVLRARHQAPLDALRAVLLAYASQGAHDHGSLGQLLHALPHVHDAHRHLQSFVSGIVAEAISAGDLSEAPSADERARFALAALQGGHSTSHRAVGRVVDMALRGIGAGA
ncbi:MAG: helix-turn-helix domain-containing protein [Devosia sp.]